jgi:hypothetical protein
MFRFRFSGGGSYEGQCRFAFYRQENISERTPPLLGRAVLCRHCNESGGSEVRGPERREFIMVLGGAAAWPLVARAQQPARLRHIGILLLGNAEAAPLRTELRESLRKSGYVDGQNLQFEVRSADGKVDRLPNLAAELVAAKVDVIVAHFTASALAAKRATTEIPIVFVAGDPVGTGIVPSLARPGGNLTGEHVVIVVVPFARAGGRRRRA